jgi:KDO2-lipid IV(A) lauroyltransferase
MEMWDNIGRVLGEFPHLGKLDVYHDPRIEVVGAEHIDAVLNSGKPGILFTAHLGNWELTGYPVAQRAPRTLPMGVAYRAANDPAAAWLVEHMRKRIGIELLPKGAKGSRRIVEILQAGGQIGLLPDQKMNDGIAVPFFGRPAMTSSSLARLALKFNCVILPGRAQRVGGTRFRLIADPLLELPDSGDLHADILTLTTRVNEVIEGWIREKPGQWFWVHKRWPD